MVAVTYQDLLNVMHLTTSELPAADGGYLLDMAIDLLNLYSDADMSNLSGGTVTLTASQRGAVLLVARTLYASVYKDVSPATVGGMTVTPADVLANPTIERFIRLAAKKLSPRGFERA